MPHHDGDHLLLSLLAQTPFLASQDLAALMGLHPITVRRHLARLEHEHLVECVRPAVLGAARKALWYVTMTGIQRLNSDDPVRFAHNRMADPVALLRQLPLIARFQAVQSVCTHILTIAQHRYPAETIRVTWKRMVQEMVVVGPRVRHLVMDGSLLMTIDNATYGIWIILDDGMVSMRQMEAHVRWLAAYERQAPLPAVVIVTPSRSRLALWQSMHHAPIRTPVLLLCRSAIAWPLIVDGKPLEGPATAGNVHHLRKGLAIWGDLFHEQNAKDVPQSMMPLLPETRKRIAQKWTVRWTEDETLMSLMQQMEPSMPQTIAHARHVLREERRVMEMVFLIAWYGTLWETDLAQICGLSLPSLRNILPALRRTCWIAEHRQDESTPVAITLTEQGASLVTSITRHHSAPREFSEHDAAVAHLCILLSSLLPERLTWQVGSPCALPYWEQGTYHILIPDALGVVLADPVTILFAVEWDTGTENAGQWTQKIDAYDQYLRFCEQYRWQRKLHWLLIVVPYTAQREIVNAVIAEAQAQSPLLEQFPIYLTTTDLAWRIPGDAIWSQVGQTGMQNPLRMYCR